MPLYWRKDKKTKSQGSNTIIKVSPILLETEKTENELINLKSIKQKINKTVLKKTTNYVTDYQEKNNNKINSQLTELVKEYDEKYKSLLDSINYIKSFEIIDNSEKPQKGFVFSEFHFE